MIFFCSHDFVFLFSTRRRISRLSGVFPQINNNKIIVITRASFLVNEFSCGWFGVCLVGAGMKKSNIFLEKISTTTITVYVIEFSIVRKKSLPTTKRENFLREMGVLLDYE